MDRHVPAPSRRFPTEPARVLVLDQARERRLSLPELARTLPLSPRTFYRTLVSATLSWVSADRVAIALGRHPCQIWPDWFCTDETLIAPVRPGSNDPSPSRHRGAAPATRRCP